ncbi:hypothetical protein L208DRAFT_1418040, partial [Tricholoma matsutake]
RTEPLCISCEKKQLSTTNNAHPMHPHTPQTHISNRRTVNNNSSQPTTRAPRTHTHTERQLAYLVLINIPFSIPFDVRVSIFRNFVFNAGNTLNSVLNLISQDEGPGV